MSKDIITEKLHHESTSENGEQKSNDARSEEKGVQSKKSDRNGRTGKKNGRSKGKKHHEDRHHEESSFDDFTHKNTIVDEEYHENRSHDKKNRDESHENHKRKNGKYSDDQSREENHSNGKHGSGKYSDDQSREEKHSNGKHGSGKHNGDRSREEKHSNGKHDDGKHSNGKHGDGKLSNGKHDDGKLSNGKHGSGKHSDEQSREEKHSNGKHNDGERSNSKRDNDKHVEDGHDEGKRRKGKNRGDMHSGQERPHTGLTEDDILFGGFFGEESLLRDPFDSDIYEEFGGKSSDEAYCEYLTQATKDYDETNGILVAGIKFKTAGKVYYFNPEGFELSQGDNVIVETARGLEFGELASDPYYVSEKSVVKPLKKVLRIATEDDIKKHNENIEKKRRAVELCQKKVTARNLDMKLIDVEYTFDDSKIIFYFTADGRVDFRELVKDLASVFRMRIELRQIGVRDEAKMIGGIGTCGRGLCCHSWLPDFQPVSIKMAKTQGLSLNPAKISGICGRLMCCLKYENDVYNTLKQGMPDQGEKVRTDDGMAVVVSTNILREQVNVRHILDEIDDETGEQKLSQDISTYAKNEIKRLGKKKHSKKAREEKYDDTEDLPDDVKSLLDD